ncbi:Ig-like domain-containing protein [Caulobacter sp. SL161]|uniref:Ig-like domain-containing protein n=1 Tax=Caulobacter sp. SL161 TaxID=2995156 RepID=UPI002274242D|nr:Ig-like domain-containing protein [Caulobacter sp. SL161]MCY1649160.1 Ig-like domain-containing protein [Caulobacter sp. SL161]
MLVALSTSVEGQAQSVQTDYTYDVHGRLVTVARPGSTTTYTYDNAQNRTRVVTTSTNNAPVANADGLPGSLISVTPGNAVAFNPLTNDTDADSDAFFLTNVSGWNTSKGSVSFTANCLRTATSCVTYTALSGASGTDTFAYAISDGKGGVATGSITVTINAAVSPPVTSASTTSVTANFAGSGTSYPLSLSISGGTPTSLAITSAPPSSAGVASVSGTSILFTPANGYSGQTQLQYTATNAGGTSAAATATINVRPVVNNVTGQSATAGQAASINLAGYAATNGVTSMSLPNGPNTAKGVASFSGTTLTYTPNPGQTGSDTFAYTGTSAGGTSAPANITFNIQSCTVPVAGASSATVPYNSASNVIPLNLSGGAATSVNYVTGTSHGSVEPIGATMYYSPFPGYFGSDSFTYNATNACGTSNTATGYITVSPPPNQSPSASPDFATIAASVNASGETYAYFDPRTNDSDPDGDPLTLVSVTAPSDGSTWTNPNNYISYIPPVGWSGNASFYYTISDGRGGTAQSYVVVTVNPPPPPPPPNSAPTANPGTTDPVWQSTTAYVDPTSNDTDPDGNTLTIQSIDSTYCAYGMINGVSTCPSNVGSISRSGNTLIYNAPFLSSSGTPGSNYMAFVVWYTISDSRGGTSQSYQIFNVYGPQ